MTSRHSLRHRLGVSAVAAALATVPFAGTALAATTAYAASPASGLASAAAAAPSTASAAVPAAPAAAESASLASKVDALERAEIETALRRARGVKARAAQALGLSRPTLDKKMADLDIDVWRKQRP